MKGSIFDPAAQNENLPLKIVAGLERISKTFRALLWDHAKVTGLSPIQIQILVFIRFHRSGLNSVSLLASEFNVSKATISDSVKILNDKDLIKKQPSDLDKRAYTISLTEKGSKIVREAGNFADPIKEIVEKISKADQRDFFSHIVEVIWALNKSEILSMQRMCFNCNYYTKKKKQGYCNLMKRVLAKEDLRLDCPEFEGLAKAGGFN